MAPAEAELAEDPLRFRDRLGGLRAPDADRHLGVREQATVVAQGLVVRDAEGAGGESIGESLARIVQQTDRALADRGGV